MTFIRDQVEYLDEDETAVYQAVQQLAAAGQSGNNSQIARKAGMPATRVAKITRYLWARSYLRDASKGAAYHWRPTSKTVHTHHELPQPETKVIYP